MSKLRRGNLRPKAVKPKGHLAALSSHLRTTDRPKRSDPGFSRLILMSVIGHSLFAAVLFFSVVLGMFYREFLMEDDGAALSRFALNLISILLNKPLPPFP